jgi:hypothetical protein
MPPEASRFRGFSCTSADDHGQKEPQSGFFVVCC